MPPSKTPHILLALFCVVFLLAVCWPGYAWAGVRIEPYVLGLPFSFAWVVGWLLTAFVVIAIYHRVTAETNER